MLPKITATRDKDAQPIEKLVEYFAEKNPQKFRQVGMQYDLAHAKGGIPDEDHRIEAWKAEKKRREAQRKKEEKAAAEKEKVKLEVDIVLPPAPTPTADLEGKTPVQDGETDDFQDAAESLSTEDSGKLQARTVTNGVKKRLTFRRKPQLIVPTAETDYDTNVEENSQEQTAEVEEEQVHNGAVDEDKTDKKKKKDKHDKEEEDKEKKSKDEKKDDSDSDEDSSDSEDDEDNSARWNAVCVTCLRVYSKDPDLSISLVKTGLAEETSSLVQGGEPAGATM